MVEISEDKLRELARIRTLHHDKVNNWPALMPRSKLIDYASINIANTIDLVFEVFELELSEFVHKGEEDVLS